MKKIFKDARGQKNAVSILSSQVNSGSLSHAYIFLGKNGIGKEYIAKRLARIILCENSQEDECPSCSKFARGVHPDFIKISGEDGIKIEDIRSLLERINLSPNISMKKVVLITKAENLGIEAANALLKTFEEPPSDTVIILTAVSEKAIPQTIVSRGQKIRFRELDESQIKEILKGQYPNEKIEEVIPFSYGSISEAIKMLKDYQYLNFHKKVAKDTETILTGGSVLEKFKIIETYEKEKQLKVFFDNFSQIVFYLINERLNKKDNQKDDKPDLIAINKVAKKVLKIYSKLDYNVNLRTALEEIIIQDLTDD